jgi:beta-lactamase superfamily II metal-dependent hydrolase
VPVISSEDEMKRSLLTLVIGVALAAAAIAQKSATKTLDVYFVDMEGGKATLFVTPSGETVLIDSGNPGGRDTDRIMAAIDHAGVRQIDHLVSTHYHVDHIGGMAELARRIPIRHFVDHGPTVEAKEQVAGFQQTYAGLFGAAKHTVANAGDRLPVRDLDWRIVMSGGQPLRGALPGGGQANGGCSSFEKKNAPNDENGQSVGSVVSFGQFRLIDLGDLVWNDEFNLVCPRNMIGPVDVYSVSHHGMDASGSSTLVHAIRPRVAIMQNGTRKGGTVGTYQTLRSSPGFEDVWQLHWSHNALIEHNPPGVFIANVDDAATIAALLTAPPPEPGARGRGGRGAGQPPHTPAYWIKISAETDGEFTVSNSRTGFSKRYTNK